MRPQTGRSNASSSPGMRVTSKACRLGVQRSRHILIKPALKGVGGIHEVNQNPNLSSADHAHSGGVLGGERKLSDQGLAGHRRPLRPVPEPGFQDAAADGAQDGAVCAHRHPGTDGPRRRPASGRGWWRAQRSHPRKQFCDTSKDTHAINLLQSLSNGFQSRKSSRTRLAVSLVTACPSGRRLTSRASAPPRRADRITGTVFRASLNCGKGLSIIGSRHLNFNPQPIQTLLSSEGCAKIQNPLNGKDRLIEVRHAQTHRTVRWAGWSAGGS